MDIEDLREELGEEDPVYSTEFGSAYHGDSRELLKKLPDESINLVVTSPPFALQKKKEYGNKDHTEYNDWFVDFAEEVYRVLTEDGSFVIDIGGAWEKGEPVRSLYHFKLLNRLAGDDGQFNLAQDFYWYNPAKLPTPAQWVTIERIRAKDAVNHVWWLSKSKRPKADNKKVLQEYSDSQKDLMENGYDDKERPSGHDISDKFDDPKENGSIPPNLLEIANTASNTHYLKACRELDIDSHPARFPRDLPEFFIKFLTDPEDVVLDIFAGSNMTGRIAEDGGRYWLAFDSDRDYVENSKLRFMDMEEIKKAESQKDLDEWDV
jgi:site-specific DNA-methyltransferase (cytosine-N4-specific)